MKICKDCKVEKPLAEFYPTQGDCKECFKAKVRKNRNETNREYYRIFDKARAKDPKRIAWRKEELKKQREANPLANQARAAVASALRKRILVKEPCYCGSTRVEAHHPDYNKPLFVIWLCNKHHKHVHGRTAY